MRSSDLLVIRSRALLDALGGVNVLECSHVMRERDGRRLRAPVPACLNGLDTKG
jgi:hypothetical protein